MINKLYNNLLQSLVFVYEVFIVVIQISYILVVWSYLIIRYLFTKVFKTKHN